jgi:DMSO/TMAO reductase YedYZ heme-binding membrane subunit
LLDSSADRRLKSNPAWSHTPLGGNIRFDMLGALGGAGLNGQALVMLRGQVADIIIGSVFLFVGLAACGIAGIGRRSGTRIFAWLGIWSAMYGAMHLSQSQAVVAVSARWLQISAPYANTAMTYCSSFLLRSPFWN